LNLESQLDLLRVQIIEDITEEFAVEASRRRDTPAVFSVLCDDDLLTVLAIGKLGGSIPQRG
jgi:hypothetical protein